MVKKNFGIVLIFMFLGFFAFSQAVNDECIYAKFIPDVDEYCSSPNEFDNSDATASAQAKPFCWPQGTGTHDVWFSFKPKNVAVYMQLTGLTILNQGTLQLPSMTVYSGSCGSLVEEGCGSVLLGDNVVELTLTNLTIGQLYYIRIDGRTGNVGKFKLCINTFSPVKPPESDCKDAVILCNKDPFYVENLAGIGDVTNEVDKGSCIREEFASVWYKWTCKDAGSLTFSIDPNNKVDDIDFAVYELPGGLNDCDNKKILRCMASGETIGSPASLNSPCFGDTGLSLSSTDIAEQPGCQSGDDNYVAAINMEVGKSYLLLVNNFSQSGYGFSITWGGTGTFQGPEADFEALAVDAFECDKTIVFTNKSSSATDPIVSYKWSFGTGADIPTSTAIGPHAIVYNSFGVKTAALIVESSKGCVVTKVVDFFVNPCCKDTSTLAADALTFDLTCFGLSTGQIIGAGVRGAPEYSFSLDSINYQPNPKFSNLTAGDYTLYVRDIKGCVAEYPVTLIEPEELIANAGEDIVIDLGEDIQLDGSFTPYNNTSSVEWSPPKGLYQTDILDPEGIATNNHTYVLTVTDENGCTDTDEMQLRVRIVRPVIAPNIISFGSINNGHFNIGGGKAMAGIDRLMIFDRWGNKLYEGTNLEKNNFTIGWDGTCNGVPVNPGVFAWLAEIRFLDDVVLNYAGDVTVVK